MTCLKGLTQTELSGPEQLPAGDWVSLCQRKLGGWQRHSAASPAKTAEPPGAPGAYSMGGDGLPMGEQSHSGQEPLESVSSKPDPKTWVMLAVVPEKGASL